MYRSLTVAAIVPAYNEERLIGATVSGMPDLVDIIVVIDDASTDLTSAIVRDINDPRVRLVSHATNTGVGGAICDGHRLALNLGADVAVVMAGDNQMDPAYLPQLLDPIVDDGIGFTKGNRFGSLTTLRGMPKVRILGNVVMSFLTKAASGYWNLFDPQNGYTAIHRSALERLDLDAIARGYAFENDLLISLNILGVRARDVPLPASYGDEVSHLRIHAEAPRMFRLLFRGFWRRMLLKYIFPSFSAVGLLLLSGLFMCTVGLGFGALVVVSRIEGESPTAGTALLAVAPMLTGIYLLVQALVLDMVEGTR